MKDILYFNTLEDIKIVDMLRTTSKDKELPNLIILTILSAGAGLITPVFSKDASGTTVFASIDEIGTKFILDGKEVTSDDFLVTTGNITYFGLHFKDSNEHTLKVSLVNSTINQNTFVSNNYLTKVIIGTSITSIGDYAFGNCIGLTSVTIPNSVTQIGGGAFYSCSGMTSVSIGNSVTTIGEYAFEGCSGLTSLTIGYSVETIGDNAFKGCSGLTQVTIPNSVTEIGRNAFNGCSSLTEMTIPNSITTIPNACFSGCSSLTSVSIGNSVTKIGGEAFKGCTGLTNITIPDSVTEIEARAFDSCTGLASITIPDSVTEISDYTFSGCSGLTSMVVEDGNTKYDSRNNCNAIIETATNALISGCKNTIIPNSVTSIGERAFYECTGLTSVIIPNSVTSIGYESFNACSGLNLITSLATTAPTIYSTTFQNIKTSGTLHVPAGSDYSAWMSTSYYYLGKYNWTKVEDA